MQIASVSMSGKRKGKRQNAPNDKTRRYTRPLETVYSHRTSLYQYVSLPMERPSLRLRDAIVQVDIVGFPVEQL